MIKNDYLEYEDLELLFIGGKMDYIEFLQKYDYEGSVVLLEGKREVSDTDKDKLFELGRSLVSRTEYIIFRSGNAAGADHYFSCGVVSVDKKQLQLIAPYSNHRSKASQDCEIVSPDDLDLTAETEIINQSKLNKKTKKLIDKYVAGERNKNTIKAAYIIRDTIKVLGTKSIGPASFAFFYDNLSNPMSGGTGHTMNICRVNNIPYIDQTIWLKWLENN